MSAPPAGVPTASELLAGLEVFGIRLGLDSTRRLLARLGEPQRRFDAVLVAGTNGKGSTAALLAAMATAAGVRTGLYTSPHLEEPGERVRVDGRSIADAALAARLGEVLAAAKRGGGEPPTHFEALTAAALLHFAAERVELAVLEVGMGGRLDATNVVEPRLSVITEVALDHEEHLGPGLRRIAAEKAGILRPGTPAVVAVGQPVARSEIAARAARLEAPLSDVGRETEVMTTAASEAGQSVTLRTPAGVYRLSLALAGAHQLDNLAAAVCAAEELAARGWPALDAAAIARGAAACRWPGRLERVEIDARHAVLLDAAHNAAAAAALAAHARRIGPYALLFGALADKDVATMLPPLAAAATRVFLTAPPERRALDPEVAARWLEGEPAWSGELGEALDRALAASEPMLLVCGSIYLVGRVRAELRRRFGVPPPAAAPLFDYAG